MGLFKSPKVKRLLAVLNTEDGGPGSGNWGHKGRPGLRGGSGKGGGSQYRGGKAGVLYTSSRRDWLNGLSGERQHEAQAWKTRYEQHYAQMSSTARKSLEQNIMEEPIKNKFGGSGNKMRSQLLEFMAEARGWDNNAQRLTDENWTDEDHKLAEAIATKYGVKDPQSSLVLPDESDTDKWDDEDLRCWQDLKSKAMGGPTSGEEAPDELQYSAGLKERPKGVDFSWYDPSNSFFLAGYMLEAAGAKVSYGHVYSADELKEVNQRMLDRIKYENPSPNDLSYYGLRTINSIRNGLTPVEKTSYGRVRGNFKYTQEMLDRLDANEKEKLLQIVNTFSNRFVGFGDLSEVGYDDFVKAEENMRNQTPRSNAQKQPYKDYILLQEKMLLGAEPTDEATYNATKSAEKAKIDSEEAKKADERRKKAREIDPKYAQNVEDAKKALRNNGMLGIIDSAQTTDEVESALSMKGLFKNNGLSYLQGMDVDIAKSVANMYGDMFQRFPFLVGQMEPPDMSERSKTAFASSSLYVNGRISFSPTNYTSSVQAATDFERSVKDGFHPKGLDHTSVPYHEFGHSLDGWLSRQLKETKVDAAGRVYLADSIKNTVSYDLCLSVKKALKIGGTVDDFRGLTSTYGMTGKCRRGTEYIEWFAETFSEAYCSKNPRPPAVELRKQLEALIKKNGWG